MRVIDICNALGWLLACTLSAAAMPLSGEDIARQVDYVNRFDAVRNIIYGDRESRVVVLNQIGRAHV